MHFKAIILDLDNTLYAYAPCHHEALAAVSGVMAKELNLSKQTVAQTYEQSRSEVHRILKGSASSHNRLLYFQRMLELLKVRPFPLAGKLYKLYWEAFIEKIELSNGVVELLLWGKKQNRKFAVLTDLTADVQHEKIIRLGLSDYIDILVTSEEVGFDKPHPSMFQACLRKLGLSARDVCMIGDDLEKDIYGARNQNITGYWITEHLTAVPKTSDVKTYGTFQELYENIRG
ncbi:MAG: HAD family hydrolase [Candidatus Omnitrophica bacterium]|nr:HAD family hydrolase [Candidatus Omnitrophota bacterium]